MKFTKKLVLTITLFLSGASARGLSLFTDTSPQSPPWQGGEERGGRTGTVPGLLWTLPLFAMLCLLWSSPVLAGELDSPGAPSSGSGMPTLQGIYDRLDTGAFPNVSGGFAEPAAGPGATGVSLGNLTSVLPRPDNTNGLAPANAPDGKTFWGLRTDGTWGPQTGSNSNVVDTSSGDAVSADLLNGKKAWVDGGEVTGNVPAGSSVTGTGGSLVITITDGLYSGSKTATAQDTDLASGNIKSGVTIFGVAGDSNVVDTSSGDAVAGDIANGKTAWVDGNEITGSLSGSGPVCTGTMNGNRWCDQEDGTVLDMTTGLLWLKNAGCLGRHMWTNLKPVFNDAHTVSGTLKSGSCGLTDGSVVGDWRLPTKNELYAIGNGIDPARSSSIMHAFTGIQADYYWSDTPYADDNSKIWVASMGLGIMSQRDMGSSSDVWPVRAHREPYQIISRWLDMYDGTVIDLTTELEWQQSDDDVTRNWFVASGTYDATHNSSTSSYCGDLSLDGGGWRLPSKDELYAITSGSEPVLSSSMRAFTYVKSSSYWSSTTYPGYDGAFAWFVNFNDGKADGYVKPTIRYVRCVR